MKTLYIEANMGASGDMLTGALLEIAPEGADKKIQNLGIPGVRTEFRHDSKLGVGGTHVAVFVNGHEEVPGAAPDEHAHDHESGKYADIHSHCCESIETAHEHEHTLGNAHGEDTDIRKHTHEHGGADGHGHVHNHHEHHSLSDIENIIDSLDISSPVKKKSMAVYSRIAAAESMVHGEPVDMVHFHEVGALDAVADIVSVCLLMDMINPDCVVVSPVNTGSGSVKCAHGIMPVPAPATAEILKGIPCYQDGKINSELTTPTGAALIAEFADEFGYMPAMTVEKTGTGTGTKDLKKANIIRVFIGERFDRSADYEMKTDACRTEAESTPDTICELSANIDDMTGEELGFAMEQLLKKGALDVYQTPIIMKKSRPAVKISCICAAEEEERFAFLMLKLTSTAGIRASGYSRYILKRGITGEDSGIREKTYTGFGISRKKYEYDDLAAAAEKKGISLSDMREKLMNGMSDK